MEIALAIATLLGGVAAVWFFWDKLSPRKSSAVPDKRPSLRADHSREEILRAILESDPVADWSRHVDEFRTITSYNNDTNLRFEVKNTDDGIQVADFKEPWANRHPDPHATGYWCYLYYGATVIDRYILVSVDGGRAMLPLPPVGEDRAHPGPVKQLDYKIAQIHDSLKTLDQYMKRSRLVVEPSAT